ncbi:MAG: thymidylate synthase [Patescibacteria group bacterium]|nr:thymidylate synthase [Patescibacteria group bacterium]
MSKQTKHPEYQYLDLLKDILKSGVENIDEGTDAHALSVFGRQIRFNLLEGFPLLTTKKVYWKGVLQELYWFISGQTNIKYLVDNNVHIWDDYPYKIYNEKVTRGEAPEMSKEVFIEKIAEDEEFAAKNGHLYHVYGDFWRHWPTRTPGRTIDQLKWLISEIKADPYARNAIVSVWNPEYMYNMATPEDAVRFPLCHILYHVSIKGGKLNLQMYQRTADMFLGVPFNIASYALLTIILAKILGYEPGEFIHTFGDAHIYSNHFEQVKEQLSRKPRPFPTIKIDPDLKSIDDFRPEMVALENYDPYPTLKGDLTVAGGYFVGKKKRPA